MEARKQPSPEAIEAAIGHLAKAISQAHCNTDKLAVVGVANGGIHLATTLRERIAQTLGRAIPLGTADISFHRDDIARNPIPKDTGPTEVPIDVDGANLLLVDDVLHTGRSIRAAINEIFDLGRPNKVELVILYDRGGRKLPLQPDFCAFQHEHAVDSQVEITLDPDNPRNHAITFTQDA
jgi:pyrimidine operon attenuation protein/uracil phosphoribosyltransferase